MRFFADAMLGRLGRWLRVADFDTLYDPSVDDHRMVAIANGDDRVLLTRDRHLLRELKPKHALDITSDVPLDQLRFVVNALELDPPRELFLRCLLCNTCLEVADQDVARAAIPEGSRDLPGIVRQCPNCQRIYWEGSHVRRMRRELAARIPEWALISESA